MILNRQLSRIVILGGLLAAVAGLAIWGRGGTPAHSAAAGQALSHLTHIITT